MRLLVTALLVIVAAACGDGASLRSIDARGIDCEALLDGGNINVLVVEPGRCLACSGSGFDESEDEECAAQAGTLPPGCRAICGGGLCHLRCDGDCPGLANAGACSVGTQECPGWSNGLYVCDPACGDAGGCRPCAFDAECEAELGAGARCQRHCGTCCRQGSAYECLCI